MFRCGNNSESIIQVSVCTMKCIRKVKTFFPPKSLALTKSLALLHTNEIGERAWPHVSHSFYLISWDNIVFEMESKYSVWNGIK